MTEHAHSNSNDPWLDAERGVVSRDIFVNDDVYRAELEKIFDATWNFLAHESEVPAPGDFVLRRLGSAPVVVIRDNDGKIHALLNSCRHRGAAVCRAESGNQRHFVCPYHGWTYDRSGRLLTTTFDRLLPADFDRAKHGLVRAPRIENYRGFVFASWNEQVAPFDEFLNDFRYYIDPFMTRSPRGMQVLAPPHRWRVKANWKVGALNFIGDSQHIQTTHIGPLTLDPAWSARTGVIQRPANSFQVTTDHGHGCTMVYLPPGLPEAVYQTHPPELEPVYRATLGMEHQQLLQHLRVIVGTVFPNLSFIETQVGPAQKAIIFRQWLPTSGTEMEVLSWVLAEAEASDEYKATVLRNGCHNFGAAGVFEQDDLELWASATAASNNAIAKRYPYSFHTAVPYMATPEPDTGLPGRVFKPTEIEVAQFEFMRQWARCMRT